MSSVSIVIITLNEAERISGLLDDLVQQTHQDFEVILVDSNSDDETCAIAESYATRLPRLHIEQMSTRGVCLGRNTGANLAQYERLLFLDADVRLAPDFLQQALQHLNTKQLQVAGVYLSPKGLPKRYSLGYKLFNIGIGLTQFVFPTAIGACLFSTKRVHTTINGFDTTISLCEDCDYVNRASHITRFRMLPLGFTFDPRRLKQDGVLTTGRKYLHANLHRLFIGEVRNQKIRYEFGHYKSKP
ncbi:glycosyltransferase family 2 protein [Psychrobacter sp. FDAARGOS_221]|uniref:glycosyltransferase family 2 protein n=1 Tax=Psychrobacter sp. FDAARGOS_221 TaxID=1975705 RepID=UPI000BB545E0|nr:glycosyltransferase [Psychrobacter sp. FDAARGOS_221]PNK60718.1 glycosyl transferase [Psychrobacter sp. FDAARGOS_221]